MGFYIRHVQLKFFAFDICSFVKYPDIIAASAKLTASNPPKEIKAKITARLIQLKTIEGILVKEGDVLGFLESNANHQHIIKLSKLIDTCIIELRNNKINNVVSKVNFFKENNKAVESNGELQSNYQVFVQAYQLYVQYLNRFLFEKIINVATGY